MATAVVASEASVLRLRNAEAGRLSLLQEKYLLDLLELGLNCSTISKNPFLAICVCTHNDEQGLFHGAIDLQMDSSYLKLAYGLHHWTQLQGERGCH